jgi:hypothetical protein
MESLRTKRNAGDETQLLPLGEDMAEETTSGLENISTEIFNTENTKKTEKKKVQNRIFNNCEAATYA